MFWSPTYGIDTRHPCKQARRSFLALRHWDPILSVHRATHARCMAWWDLRVSVSSEDSILVPKWLPVYEPVRLTGIRTWTWSHKVVQVRPLLGSTRLPKHCQNMVLHSSICDAQTLTRLQGLFALSILVLKQMLLLILTRIPLQRLIPPPLTLLLLQLLLLLLLLLRSCCCYICRCRSCFLLRHCHSYRHCHCHCN